MAGYGLIRSFTEGIRGNDALLIWNTNIRVSQLLAVLFTMVSLAILFIILYKRRSVKNEAAFDAMMDSIDKNTEETGNE